MDALVNAVHIYRNTPVVIGVKGNSCLEFCHLEFRCIYSSRNAAKGWFKDEFLTRNETDIL